MIRQLFDYWWLNCWIIRCWPHIHIAHWLNKMCICAQGSNTMRTRYFLKLPSSTTTSAPKNVYTMCKTLVYNLKTPFSISR
ncbi:uncharacterized protein LOC129874454 isoform X2 [Solanum dulcamara]|uniref:uncharacterized protein LOC129874454 isoform X2 n=1 Tax=Solanum dulcamara TaxID=45834 RepID=UPI002485921B|nr:uncharacterized protein LOC129874454 isoform X2 [Solanum dulcamara]